MIKNIIFDWSGVINDCLESHFCAVNKIFIRYGIKPISLEEMRQNWVQPFMKFYNQYLPELTLDQEKEAYGRALRECPSTRAYPGIVDLISDCKKAGIKMTVLTSDLPEFFFSQIKAFGLEGVFVDTVADVHDKSEVINELIERNNFSKKQIVFIGDSNHEIEEGKAAGVKTIAVTWGFNTEASLRALKPDFVAKDLAELKSIIFNN